MDKYTYSTSLMGTVVEVQELHNVFYIQCCSGCQVKVCVGQETQFRHLRNSDKLDRDRDPNPGGYNASNPPTSDKIRKYIRKGRLVSIYGIYIRDEGREHFDARIINLVQVFNGKEETFLFEDGHWWITQITCLADNWLDNLFGPTRVYDFTKYRTNLGISGMPVENEGIQECATLSRLIYGLSSAYLLTGSERFLQAAKNGVAYQREWFRSLSHDGKYCFWSYGKEGRNMIMASQNSDDKDTIPLYEQIYCLAGLAQYYRITSDWEVLNDIKTTINTFDKFYFDTEQDGYFSHLDYATLSWNSDSLGDNKEKKNWNSVGDHLPAYLINLILALEPLPKGLESIENSEFLKTCKKMLDSTSSLIAEKFPDKENPDIPYVNERFFRDWTPDHNWKWQQNRAVCGHNLKIAWNLTRAANYYDNQKLIIEDKLKTNKKNSELQKELEKLNAKTKELMDFANKLAVSMSKLAIDQARGGVFDAVERKPEGSFIDFTWGNTKDFWQQEQGILAYLILYGYTGNVEYLQFARETMFFWNLYFLDMNQGGIYFRTTDDGLPYMLDSYANKGGHALAGYHSLELSYLAHVYIRTHVRKEPFCLFFKLNRDAEAKSINVLPDFMKAKSVEVKRVTVNGIDRTTVDPDNFQIELNESEIGAAVIVEFQPI